MWRHGLWLCCMISLFLFAYNVCALSISGVIRFEEWKGGMIDIIMCINFLREHTHTHVCIFPCFREITSVCVCVCVCIRVRVNVSVHVSVFVYFQNVLNPMCSRLTNQGIALWPIILSDLVYIHACTMYSCKLYHCVCIVYTVMYMRLCEYVCCTHAWSHVCICCLCVCLCACMHVCL